MYTTGAKVKLYCLSKSSSIPPKENTQNTRVLEMVVCHLKHISAQISTKRGPQNCNLDFRIKMLTHVLSEF